MKNWVLFLFAVAMAPPAWSAEKLTAAQLVELAKAHDAGLRAGIEATFDAKKLEAGTAWAGHGSQFFFAVDSDAAPMLVIDDFAAKPLDAIPGTHLWYATADVEPVGRLHQFHYLVNGEKFGGSLDVPAFGPLSYFEEGVPSGKLSEKIIHTSKIYDGMKSEYWIYVPAEYDAKTPAALMVFQDGGGYIHRDEIDPTLNVIDNLIAQKKIPVMICVFINPGDIADAPGTPTYNFVKAYGDKWQRTLKDSMRSTLYDTVSDRYARFLRDEILADVGAKYNLRKDAYSHAITGLSSGGICSFNAAWQMPDEFSRVISWIGSFTSIQWKEDPANPDGGQDYPEKILREPKRNIRVWLQDGANDMENPKYGSWPLGESTHGEFAEDEGVRFSFQLREGHAQSGAGFGGVSLRRWFGCGGITMLRRRSRSLWVIQRRRTGLISGWRLWAGNRARD
jgi:enterochelin esterase-like enzyme